MTTATTTLKTQNPEWGFFGTIERAGESPETAWALAFEAIQDATGAHDGNAYGPEGVRDFLDSRDGRHFADELAAFIASMQDLSHHPLKERAIDEQNKRKTA